MKNIFVVGDFVRLCIGLIILSYVLSACGRSPECPRVPENIFDCTAQFEYGSLCHNRGQYDSQNQFGETDRYDAICNAFFAK